jgi:PH (Pleckstrin Homology) domain-containing protein
MKLLRCRQWALSLGLTGAGIALMIFNLGVTPPGLMWAERVVFVGAGVGLGWFLIGRVALAGVQLREDGVFVRGPFRERFLAWEGIESFSISRYTVFSRLGVARLRDGSLVPLFGVQAIESAFNPGDRQAHEIVARLSDALAASAA